MNTYIVKVIREAGCDPITGQVLEYGEEEITIDAVSEQRAHRMAQIETTLKFQGQVMRIFIDGQEHLDENA